jgi:Zn-dependent protease with chaperone function
VIAALRATLALALLVSWYVVAATLVVLCIAFDVLVLWAESQPGVSFTPVNLFTAVATLWVIGAIVHGVLSVSRAGGPRTDSAAVTREDAPALWRTVDGLAGRVGVAPPEELFVTPDANAAVTEQARMLGLLPGQRSMYVGVPLLLGLSAAELRAVLCHELGHHAKGHTRFGALTWRGSAALHETRQHLMRSAAENGLVASYGALLYRFIAAYSNIYDRLTLALRRRQEFAADAAAARVAGAAATVSALRAVHSLDAAWGDFRRHLLEPSLRAGLRPDDPFTAFETMLADPDYRDVLADHRRDPPDRPPSAWDSHPSLAQRLTALTREAERPSPGGGLSADATLGITPDLWAGLPARAAVTTSLTKAAGARHGPAKVLPWARWLEKLAEDQAMGPVLALSAAVRAHGGSSSAGGGAPLGALLRVLDAGAGADLAARLPGGRTGGDAGDRLRIAITMLIGHHLVTAGHAVWLVGWTGRPRLVCHDIATEDIHELVRSATEDPAEVSRLRLHLAELDIDPDLPAALPAGRREAAVVTIPAWHRPTWRGELRAGLRNNRGMLTLLCAVMGVVLVLRFGASDQSGTRRLQLDRPTGPSPATRPVPVLPGPALPPEYAIPCGLGSYGARPACPYHGLTIPPLPLPTRPLPLHSLHPPR